MDIILPLFEGVKREPTDLHVELMQNNAIKNY